MDTLEKRIIDWVLGEIVKRGENSRSAKFGLTLSEARNSRDSGVIFGGNLSDYENLMCGAGFQVGPALTKSGKAHKSTRVIYL